tara:strand:- start:539 stop:1708 length:1170 start_codon:yes stop_codon:yes gene_type:complete
MRRNSGIIGELIRTSTDEASGIHDLFDNYNAEFNDNWPIVKKIISLSNSNGTSFPEGAISTFSITTEGFADGDTVYWTISNVSGTALAAADFDLGLSGTITINSNAGSVSIKPTADGLAENNVVNFEVRMGSVSGAIQQELTNLTVTDAAVPTGTDITSSFYEISNRFIDSQTYMSGSSQDYNGPYDVGEVQTDFSGTGRVYIGVKATSSPTYFSDVPIAGVQILVGSTLAASWIFNTSSGGSGSGWRTATSATAAQSSQGFPITPATASVLNFATTIGSTANQSRFAFKNSTGSSYTGCDNGISNSYKLSADGGSNTLAPVGNATISQSSNTYYAYRETSGASANTGAMMRSPTYSFSGGEYIRVIHAMTGPTNNQMDPDDTLYVAVY